MAIETTTSSEVREGERIAKVMARAGLCSRRDAEAWIASGRVSVNGEVLTSPAYNVGPNDAVLVDGKPLNEPQRTRLFMYHKPRGLITSAKDPEGRETVFDNLPPGLPRVVSIGRLDINTEGLLLLTNDGGLARVLELPETGWLRRYRVRAHGEVNQAQLDALKDGIALEGIVYAGIEARLERTVGSNVWLTMGLREGKNREIKRVLEHLGLLVNRLIRISFGPFELAELPEGEVDEIPTRVLRDQLGVKLAKRAHADFDSPVYDPAPAEPEPAPIVDRPPRREDASDRRGKRPEIPEREPRRTGGTTEPRKRKHVSILRAEARAEAETERKRVVRSATSDRKGREIKVEHFSQARPARAEKSARAEKPAGREGGAARKRSFGGDRPEAAAPKTRNYANASARNGASKFRKPAGEGARDDAPRARSYGDAPARDGAAKFRKPREESSARPARTFGDGPKREGASRAKSYGDAPARDGAAKFRKPREESSARPARAFGDGPKREGAPRARTHGDGAAKDGAAKFRKPREGSSRDEAPRSRPPREGAGRDGGFKSGGGRPAGQGGSAPRGGGAKRPPRRPS